ncbi:MAG: hypothetical protein ACTSW1_06930 [Candidatus Hodarchaeales archaeon]
MDVLHLLGLAFVAIAIVLWITLGIRLIFSYKKSQKPQTLYLALLFLFGGIAMAFLAIEQGILLTSADPALSPTPYYSILKFTEINNIFLIGYLGAAMAWIFSSSAIIAVNFFTHSFFPGTSKKVLIAPIVLISVYLIIIILAPFSYSFNGTDWSPDHEASTNFILWILFLIPLWIVVLLFLYLSIQLKRRGVSTWRRLFWIFASQFLLSFSFTVEILNPSAFTALIASLGINIELLLTEALWSTGSRFGMMIYPILMWIGVFTPDWAKGKLGVSS